MRADLNVLNDIAYPEQFSRTVVKGRNQAVLPYFFAHLCLESPLSSWSDKEKELCIGLVPHLLSVIEEASPLLGV